MSQRPRKSLHGAPLRTLAVLLLMNGTPVSAPYIADVLGIRSNQAVRIHLATLKEHGVWQIVSERCDRRHVRTEKLAGAYWRYRLAGLPPDDLLDKLLAEVDQLKRSLWWAELTSSRRQRTA